MAHVWLFAGGSASLMMAAKPSNPFPRRRIMATKKAPKKAAPKAPKAKGAKSAPAKKAKVASGKPKKLSALDAAAQVLAVSKEPMNAKEMIDAMAAKKLWTSPGGKTPHATLYSAILREIATKGKGARFKKTDRGHFAANG
jgi:HB1, ASXL, restriction endonuclease HTH domain